MASRDFPPHNNLFITIGLAENRGGVIHGRTTSRDQLEKSAVTRRNDALCKVTQVGAHIYSSIPYEVRLLSRFLLLLACTDHVEVEEEQRCPAILERRRLSQRGSDRPRLEPTPTPLTGEATKPRRNGKTRGKKGGLSLRDGKTVNENHRRVTSKGGRGEHVPTKTITNVPPPHTKGERTGRKWTSTDRTQKITVLCHSTSILLTQIAPGSERVEIGVNRMKNKKST